MGRCNPGAAALQILVIAVLMKGILHRTFTVFQWEALVLLVAGITVNQLNYCTKDGGGVCALSRLLPYGFLAYAAMVRLAGSYVVAPITCCGTLVSKDVNCDK